MFNNEIRTLTGTDASVRLLEELGLTLSTEVAALPQNDSPGRASVSAENLGVLDADVVIFSFPAGGEEYLESIPVFGQLDAVRAGRYVRLETDTSTALAFPSALSIPYGLDRMVRALSAILT